MDGETDLKTRVIPKSCAGLTTEQLLNLKVCDSVPAGHCINFYCDTEISFDNFCDCCIQ